MKRREPGVPVVIRYKPKISITGKNCTLLCVKGYMLTRRMMIHIEYYTCQKV